MNYSGISWTDRTHNYWEGCAEVSAGCDNCYARILVTDRFGRVIWGPDGTRRAMSEKYNLALTHANNTPWSECLACGWRGPTNRPQGTKRNPHHCDPADFNLTPTTQRVFVLSLGDFFEVRKDLVELRRAAVQHMQRLNKLNFLILTKRINQVMPLLDDVIEGDPAQFLANNPHMMIGTSVENRKSLWRVNALAQVPTAMRWLSLEPLLEGLDLSTTPGIRLIDWGIIGGESGKKPRPLRYSAAVRTMAHLVANNITPFFKQWGEWVPAMEIVDSDGFINSEWWAIFHSARPDWGVWQDGKFEQHTKPWPTAGGFVMNPKETMFRIGKKSDPCTIDGKIVHNFPAQLR